MVAETVVEAEADEDGRGGDICGFKLGSFHNSTFRPFDYTRLSILPLVTQKSDDGERSLGDARCDPLRSIGGLGRSGN